MSGTSLDGVDGVLVECSESNIVLRLHASAPLAPELRAELLALNSPGPQELHRAALAANALARSYAQVVHDLLRQSGTAAQQVRAIGAHGQTVRHRPGEFDGTGYTLQLNNPALLAELTGIDVVADFRSRDVAAGGQGAPLVPAFHQAMFSREGETVAVLNLGGMSNLSILPGSPEQPIVGFDCGPGNALLDTWCQQHTGQAFDRAGAWAASGKVLPALLAVLLQEPFLAAAPPKSTGRDLFNAAWLQQRLQGFADAAPADVQASLTALTAHSCADALRRFGAASRHLVLCGGGAFNDELVRQLRQALPGVVVSSSAAHGLPPLQVEAGAFAWLAARLLQRQCGNLASVTGAAGERLLGALYPA